jgi:hypothetical protein
MARNDEDVPVNISKNRARGGVTGHHMRYVLAFGLAGIIIAFVALGLFLGWALNRTLPRHWPLLRAPRKLRPQGSDIAEFLTARFKSA